MTEPRQVALVTSASPGTRQQRWRRTGAAGEFSVDQTFAGHSVQADTPMPLYASGRRTFDEVLAKDTSGGDDPAVVAKAIVAAASDRMPS